MEVSIDRGIPKSSILMGSSLINQPAMGVPPIEEPPSPASSYGLLELAVPGSHTPPGIPQPGPVGRDISTAFQEKNEHVPCGSLT